MPTKLTVTSITLTTQPVLKHVNMIISSQLLTFVLHSRTKEINDKQFLMHQVGLLRSWHGFFVYSDRFRGHDESLLTASYMSGMVPKCHDVPAAISFHNAKSDTFMITNTLEMTLKSTSRLKSEDRIQIQRRGEKTQYCGSMGWRLFGYCSFFYIIIIIIVILNSSSLQQTQQPYHDCFFVTGFHLNTCRGFGFEINKVVRFKLWLWVQMHMVGHSFWW